MRRRRTRRRLPRRPSSRSGRRLWLQRTGPQSGPCGDHTRRAMSTGKSSSAAAAVVAAAMVAQLHSPLEVRHQEAGTALTTATARGLACHWICPAPQLTAATAAAAALVARPQLQVTARSRRHHPPVGLLAASAVACRPCPLFPRTRAAPGHGPILALGSAVAARRRRPARGRPRASGGDPAARQQHVVAVEVAVAAVEVVVVAVPARRLAASAVSRWRLCRAATRCRA